MAIDPEHRRDVIADAWQLLREGEFEPEFNATVAAAEAGDDEAFRNVETSVSMYRAILDGKWRPDEPSAARANEIAARQFGDVPPVGTGREAEIAEAFIERIATGLTTHSDYDRVPRIPPVPGSAPFVTYLRDRLAISEEQAHAWQAMPVWPAVLVRAFHLLMGQDIIKDQPRISAPDRLALVDRRERWHQAISALGYGDEQLVEIFTGTSDRRTDQALVALAELRRFVSPIPLGGFSAQRSLALLVRDIEALHRAHPGLDADSFFRILPPFAETMSREGIVESLVRADPPIESFLLFRTQTILAWHAAPHAELREWIQRLVERNVRYEDLQKFCHVMFATTVGGFKEKLISMRDAGVDMRPMIRAIREKFPQARFRLPGGGRPPRGTPPAPPAGPPPPETPSTPPVPDTPPAPAAAETPPPETPPQALAVHKETVAAEGRPLQMSFFGGITVIEEASSPGQTADSGQGLDPEGETIPNPLDPTMPTGAVQLVLPFVFPDIPVRR